MMIQRMNNLVIKEAKLFMKARTRGTAICIKELRVENVSKGNAG
jgi:hypothetical protein